MRVFAPMAALLVSAAAQQPAPQLQAATIKVNESGSRSSSTHDDPGRLSFTNVSLRTLLLIGFNLKPYELSGPDWLESVRFDGAISFTGLDPKQEATQLPLVLGPWLKEQFKLATHVENRDVDGYALVVAKSGAKLKPSTAACCSTSVNGGNDNAEHLVAQTDMDSLARNLLRSVDRPVVINATGLKGTFEVRLDFTDVTSAGAAVSNDPAAPPPIFQALEQQLGLKLEPRKVAVRVMVIDHAEKTPVGN